MALDAEPKKQQEDQERKRTDLVISEWKQKDLVYEHSDQTPPSTAYTRLKRQKEDTPSSPTKWEGSLSGAQVNWDVAKLLPVRTTCPSRNPPFTVHSIVPNMGTLSLTGWATNNSVYDTVLSLYRRKPVTAHIIILHYSTKRESATEPRARMCRHTTFLRNICHETYYSNLTLLYTKTVGICSQTTYYSYTMHNCP